MNATLGDVIVSAKTIRCNDGKYPVLSMTMHDGIVLQNDRFKKSLASIDQSNYKVVKRGQLVVGFPIDEGVIYVQNVVDEGIMSPAYNVWDICTDKIVPEYLELCLHSPQSMDYYLSKLKGTTARRRSITTPDLLALPLYLPDHATQRKLVSIIRNCDRLISDQAEVLAKLDELVKARFVEMFGDAPEHTISFGDICIFLRNGANIKQDKNAKGYPITRIETISNNQFNLDRMGYANIMELGKYAGYVLIPGDILISHINSVAYLGRAVQYKCDSGTPIIHGMNLLCARIIPEYDPTYVEFFFKTRAAKDYIASITKKSVNQASITTSDLKKMQIPIATLEKQKSFASFVAQSDKSKLAVQQALEKLETLKKSLMQQYFG